MLIHGDCLDVFKDVRGLASIVSDPPGGGGFMGLKFDHHRGGRDAWIREMAARFKVAREATERGAWGLFWSFGLTAHWTPCALDDAGWQYVRPIGHLHGQGWPKARSQLKPAKEIWHLVRWGTGGVRDLQIDRCRVRRAGGVPKPGGKVRGTRHFDGSEAADGFDLVDAPEPHEGGSWPPDVLLSHAGACREVGTRKVRSSEGVVRKKPKQGACYGEHAPGIGEVQVGYGTETIPAWECLAACTCGLASLSLAGGDPAPCPGCGEERWWACPVAELDGQSGTLTSGTFSGKRAGLGYGGGKGTEADKGYQANEGGASRLHEGEPLSDRDPKETPDMSGIQHAQPLRKGETSAEGRTARIEAAIQAARAVAASPGAIELSRRPRMPGDKHTRGTWTSEDDRRLRERGEILLPDGQIYTLRGGR